MAVKLYGAPMSTCTARVLICLHELQAEFEFVPVDTFAREQKQPSFLSKNPFGLVPVLEDGELTLFESRAIIAYLLEKYKDRRYDLTREGNPKEAALVRVWMEVEAHHYNPAIRPILFETFVASHFGKSPNQSVIDSKRDESNQVLDVYEARLSTTKYLAGDFYSLADLYHLPCTRHLMKSPHADLILSRPHVKAWWEDVSSRPAYQKVAINMDFDAV
ncbi:hypothetical protein Nepgr_027812 [Nepenthes gracilis]|uniref:glutathione transferase n=1 Tax=Nepenthes gracilis TaxID=150966 RepID=A0AAD3TBL6_NEPGR|nr:hypothetical protein Nepgr_027812 [Nepenthes gracilis]